MFISHCVVRSNIPTHWCRLQGSFTLTSFDTKMTEYPDSFDIFRPSTDLLFVFGEVLLQLIQVGFLEDKRK